MTLESEDKNDLVTSSHIFVVNFIPFYYKYIMLMDCILVIISSKQTFSGYMWIGVVSNKE